MKNKLMLLCSIAMVLSLAANVSGQGFYEFSGYGTSYGYDVASYGDTIYWGSGASVQYVDVAVANLAMVDEPTHLVGPDGIYGTADDVTNPNYQTRTFSNYGSVNLTGSPMSLYGGSIGEMYVDADYIYTLGYNAGSVYAFDKTTGAYHHTAVAGSGVGDGWGYSSLLSYGGGQWWLANENRHVYSSTGSGWTYEFTWHNMAGSHGDGMEYVNGNVWVSDMTSNYLARWGEGDNPETVTVESGWNEWNRFSYVEEFGGSAKYVEGMGFGALGHFWAGAGSSVYEIGGGEVGDYTVVPVPGALLIGSIGLAFTSLKLRRRKEL